MDGLVFWCLTLEVRKQHFKREFYPLVHRPGGGVSAKIHSAQASLTPTGVTPTRQLATGQSAQSMKMARCLHTRAAEPPRPLLPDRQQAPRLQLGKLQLRSFFLAYE